MLTALFAHVMTTEVLRRRASFENKSKVRTTRVGRRFLESDEKAIMAGQSHNLAATDKGAL
jgi:hypothetical protein